MQKLVLVLLSVILSGFAYAQNLQPQKIQPDSTNYKNIYVKKVAEDQDQTCFIIWVKNDVKPHYHKNHTEIISVVSGKGLMTVGDKSFEIKKGDAFIIPKGVHHSVITTSRKALKVLSIQCPKFDGDRIWVNE